MFSVSMYVIFVFLVGQVMSIHHYDQMSSICVYVVFVFVIVFLLVKSCIYVLFLITSLKGNKSLEVLYSNVFFSLVSQPVSQSVTRSHTELKLDRGSLEMSDPLKFP